MVSNFGKFLLHDIKFIHEVHILMAKP